MRFKGKKGAAIVAMMIEILIVATIVFLAFQLASAYASSETTNKINVANDFKMMVETLVAIPGEITINYPNDLSKFNLILKEGDALSSSQVKIWLPGEVGAKQIERSFFLPDGFVVSGHVGEKKDVCLRKEHKAGFKSIILMECENA